jgi:hypothetical protein
MIATAPTGATMEALFSRLRLYYLRNWHVPTAELDLAE